MEGKCKLCGFNAELLEAITSDGIVYVCERCVDRNELPLLRKQKSSEKDSNKELQSIVTRNIRKRNYTDLIDNFHWHIQQARRFKKISQKQLGDEIAEPEIIISMAEKAELPEDYEKIIVKFEQYLGVRLFNEKKAGDIWASKGKVDLKKADFNSVTMGDLKKIHDEKIKGEKEPVVTEQLKSAAAEQPKKTGFFSRIFWGNSEEKKAELSEEPAKTL